MVPLKTPAWLSIDRFLKDVVVVLDEIFVFLPFLRVHGFDIPHFARPIDQIPLLHVPCLGIVVCGAETTLVSLERIHHLRPVVVRLVIWIVRNVAIPEARLPRLASLWVDPVPYPRRVFSISKQKPTGDFLLSPRHW